MAGFKRVDPKKPLTQVEEAILDYWKQNDIFRKSIENREGKPKFVFYEGPPTANGKPGIHHVLARTPRTWFAVTRPCKAIRCRGRQGGTPMACPWKSKLSARLSSKQDIEEYGIEAFNQKCRESVFAYEKEWRLLTERIAYW